MENGNIVTKDSSANLRQAICQINRNNFVLITNTTNNRSAGLGFLGTAKVMKQLNCNLGLNLDGGGSINMFYKGQSPSISTLKSSTRKLVDVMYFVDK